LDLKKYHFSFAVSDRFGWGLYGYNLVMEAHLQKLFLPLPRAGIEFSLPLDPFSHRVFDELQALWKTSPPVAEGDTMLVSLGNEQVARQPLSPKVKQVGLTFFEHNPLPEAEIRGLREFELVIAGSTWNLEKLRAYGVDRSKMIIQGVNSDLFRPMPKRAMKERFVVFSGGKLEFRKGQDLVVAAFARFAKKHRDAVLVAAWSSPWSTQLAPTINLSAAAQPLREGATFAASLANWVGDNGIAADQFIDLGSVPNRFMPEVLREVDVAVFPNRCEGGTNLVAMEALASGLICILSKNTGHLDLIRADNCLPLATQRPVAPVAGIPTREWGESDVEEIVAHLEKAYSAPGCVKPETARASVAGYSWARAIKTLYDTVEAS
jgi:glycosyltransferase involved in cell wall biosynthesis